MARSKPSITGTIHTLPFDKLSPRDFERLCLWLVEREGYERAEHLGAAGTEQGRDIVAWREDKLWTFQCKRVRRFGPKAALQEVEKVLALPESERPAGLVFLVTCDVSANTRQQVRERCAGLMECDFWAGTELDEKAKRHRDIVQEFFWLPVSVDGTIHGRGTGVGEALFEREVATYTYRIRITHPQEVKVEVQMPDGQLASESSSNAGYAGETQEKRVQELVEAAAATALEGSKAAELGEALFALLLDGDRQRELVDLYYRARREKARLRIELDVDEGHLPDLANLPWELMRIPSAVGHGPIWLATAPGLALVRKRENWVTRESIQLRSGERFRIALAVAALSEGDLNPDEYEGMWKRLKDLAFHQPERIELFELVNPATVDSINSILEQDVHVLHFMGHAQLTRKGDEAGGQIALLGEAGQLKWLDAHQFGQLLQPHPPSVVVFQACENAAPDATKVFASIASQLVAHNVPVAVVMQYAASNTTARRFAPEFYRRLSNFEPVDLAASGAWSTALKRPVHDARDFAAPILFMNVREGRLLRLSAVVRKLHGLPEYYELNRRGQIARLERILEGDGAGIMIWGKRHAGHTEFLHIAKEIMKTRGINVLDHLDAGRLDDVPDEEFFVSELEDRLNIATGAVFVSADGKKKRRKMGHRLREIVAALRGLLDQDASAIIFFALHEAADDTLHWFWHKLWLTYLQPFTNKGLWALFFCDEDKGTEWWSPSPAEPEFIPLDDFLKEDLIKFYVDIMRMSIVEATFRANQVFESRFPSISPEEVYGMVWSTLKWRQERSMH